MGTDVRRTGGGASWVRTALTAAFAASPRLDQARRGHTRRVHSVLIQATLVLGATVAIVASPFGRRTLSEIGRDGLMFRHARHLVHVLTVVALLVAVAAALSAR